jgi:hypothetical protein
MRLTEVNVLRCDDDAPVSLRVKDDGSSSIGLNSSGSGRVRRFPPAKLAEAVLAAGFCDPDAQCVSPEEAARQGVMMATTQGRLSRNKADFILERLPS